MARAAHHMKTPARRSSTFSMRLEIMENEPDKTLAATLAHISNCRETREWRHTSATAGKRENDVMHLQLQENARMTSCISNSRETREWRHTSAPAGKRENDVMHQQLQGNARMTSWIRNCRETREWRHASATAGKRENDVRWLSFFFYGTVLHNGVTFTTHCRRHRKVLGCECQFMHRYIWHKKSLHSFVFFFTRLVNAFTNASTSKKYQHLYTESSRQLVHKKTRIVYIQGSGIGSDHRYTIFDRCI